MSETYTGVFWNVERFFDVTGGPVARSLGATVSNNWNLETYQAKLAHVAAVLVAATQGKKVGFLGLAEVETNRVANDILKELGWDDFVNPDNIDSSPGLDGNDVVLLFSKKLFEHSPGSFIKHSVTLDNRFATRDLLYCRLKLAASGQSVIFAVVHWPSRVISEGEILRTAHAFYLRRLIQQFIQYPIADLLSDTGEPDMPDSAALKARWNTPVVVMGDFNDEPHDNSVRFGLRSYSDVKTVLRGSKLSKNDVSSIGSYTNNTVKLFNPCWRLINTETPPGGTYYRDSSWRIYDQVLMTHGCLQPTSPFRFQLGSVKAFRQKDILYRGSPVEMTTRTGLPRKFNVKEKTGVSDHLPLLFEFDVVTE